MADHQEASIASALHTLMRAKNLTPARLAERSGVAPNTIGYILNGRTHQPAVRTIRRLARVTAEDPYTREVDRALMAEHERFLLVAARYVTPTTDEIPAQLELLLYYLLASREGARAWSEVIRALIALPPDVVRTIPSRLDLDAGTEPDSSGG